VVSYLDEIKRVLKPQGIAVIYFTRLIRSKSPQTETEYYADIILENAETVGYRYGGPLTTVRSIAMIISMWKMVELAEASGLEVIDKTFSYDGKGKKKKIYGQHGIVLRNPRPDTAACRRGPTRRRGRG
jgi:ubiquinone/menaquinone biosynthesis C-methylase UbiE